ncbi:MAG: protein jag [Anaerolineales bacterium]|nr:MAG: protein jag [Anaerolineales bacterium]
MRDTRTSLEIIAPNLEEALEQAAIELDLPKEAFEAEVLDEGAKGLFGLGGRQARIRLTVRAEYLPHMEGKPPAASKSDFEPATEIFPGDEDALRIAQETVKELLQRMGIEARVEGRWGQADAPDKIQPLYIDVHGEDLSILIGRGGETLAALQYITRLIAGKELKRPVAVLIDIEGYRARREDQLRRLARRLASQAVETSRTISLEPMPAFERRIVHIELRDHPDVDTLSVGEGNGRKVTIVPKS